VRGPELWEEFSVLGRTASANALGAEGKTSEVGSMGGGCAIGGILKNRGNQGMGLPVRVNLRPLRKSRRGGVGIFTTATDNPSGTLLQTRAVEELARGRGGGKRRGKKKTYGVHHERGQTMIEDDPSVQKRLLRRTERGGVPTTVRVRKS